MAVSDEFLTYVLDQLSAWGGVSARKMFGGAGLYRDARMFALVADDVLYLKVDGSNRARFVQAGSGPFRPYPDRPTEMPYYEAPADVLESPEALVEWASRSFEIAAAAKPPRSSKRSKPSKRPKPAKRSKRPGGADGGGAQRG